MEKYSDMYDCFVLANKLRNNNIGKKMEFTSSIYQGILEGKYHMYPYGIYNSYTEYKKDALDFYIKYNQEHFLRIQIADSVYRHSIGQKLVALSEIYPVLKSLVGDATLYYTTKDNLEQTLSLHWSFSDKLEETAKYQNDTAFDDASIEELIIFDDEENEDIKNWFENTIGLPIQLLPIIISNLDDFLTHKDNLTDEDVEALKILASNKTLTRKK